VFIILINPRVKLWAKQATFPSRGQLERWLHVFHLRPLYPKPQNVLYILVRGWFRELHKHCVEARGQRVLHTLARCTDSVSSARSPGRGQAGACNKRSRRAYRACRCVHLRFYAFARRVLKGPANEIPRARIHACMYTFPSICGRFQFSRASNTLEISTSHCVWVM